MSSGMLLEFIALASASAWLTMLVARGGFWLARERDDRACPAEPAAWPSVTAVVPARDEADGARPQPGGTLRVRSSHPLCDLLLAVMGTPTRRGSQRHRNAP